MTERESQEIIRMVEGTWSCDFGIEGRTVWAQMLYPFDAEIATRALAEMSKNPLPSDRFKPHPADLRAWIKKLQADDRVKALPQHTVEEGKYGTAPPEWVWVHSWTRNRRSPRNYRPFPQQSSYVDPADMMSQAEYETLRDEWVAEGSPKAETPLPSLR